MGKARSLLMVGAGVMTPRGVAALRALVERTDLPVSMSLHALGALPSDHPCCLGYHGHCGHPLANVAIHNAEVIYAVGTRLDIRQIGTERLRANVVRVEIDKAEAARGYGADHCDQYIVIRDAAEWLESFEHRRVPKWWRSLEVPDWPRLPILDAFAGAVGVRDCIVATGVGQHQHWMARQWHWDWPQRRMITSGGHGAMGFDLPSAIGAQLTYPDALVICAVGDGSFQMNIQELGFVAERNLPIKILVFNNRRLGMVSQFQRTKWAQDTACGNKHTPDFAAIARAYGLLTCEVPSAVYMSNRYPVLFNIDVDPAFDIEPMLWAGMRMDYSR